MKIALIKILLKIKNASQIKTKKIKVKNNNFGVVIIKFLYKNGIIQGYEIKKKCIIIHLRYIYNYSFFKNLKIISLPSIKIFLSFLSICRLQKDLLRFFVFSTTKGILTLDECIKHKIGGTLLFIC